MKQKTDNYKERIIEDIKKYKNYVIVGDKVVYSNPNYNLFTRRDLHSDTVLFCPQLLDEECFIYFSNYFYSTRKIRCNYRKVLDYTTSFAFVSMLVYSLVCSNRNPSSNWLILSNWIPKQIITDERIENKHNQITVDANNSNVYWTNYSTVKYVKDSQEMSKADRYLTGKVIGDYLKCVDVNRTKLVSIVKHDIDGNLYTDVKKYAQNSFYMPTEKLWKLVDRARNGELTFVTIKRDKLKTLYYDKIRKLSNSFKWDGYTDNERQHYLRIYLDDIDKDIIKKYYGWRKIGDNIPFCSMKKGSLDKDKISSYSIPVNPIELCIRSLFDNEIGVTFENVSLDIDKFYETEKKKCDFKENSDFDASTYFEFEPDKLIEILKDKSFSKIYDDHILYQLYEILSNCEMHRGKYYYRINYIRKDNGRYYGSKNIIQNMPKKLRKIVLSKYQSVDMNCGVYSLLLNIGKNLKYKGNTSEIEKMVQDRKTYREKLVDKSLGITYSDVKEKLTMISFGCRMNPEKMLLSSEYDMVVGDGNYTPYNTCLYKDDGIEKRVNVSKWCAKPEITELHNEIVKMGKFIIKKYIHSNPDGTKSLVNCIGNSIDISKFTRHSFGEKLAFIYQSEESNILKSIYDNFKLNNKRLKTKKGAIGLLLHDAVYIHKDIIKKFKDISSDMSEYVKNTFNYDIKYETE